MCCIFGVLCCCPNRCSGRLFLDICSRGKHSRGLQISPVDIYTAGVAGGCLLLILRGTIPVLLWLGMGSQP